MVRIIVLLLLGSSLSLNAFADANNSQLTTREQLLQDSQNRQIELNRAEEASRPNERSTPPRVNVNSWGIDQDMTFEITNHLLGYSTVLESGNTLQGVKFTGFVNLAYYSPTEEKDGKRKKARFVFGVEAPVYDLSKRSGIFAGVGATLGDATGIYFDAGADYHLANWFKLQGGLNYNLATGLYPQLSLGFTW